MINLEEIECATRKKWKQVFCCENSWFQLIVSNLARFYRIHFFRNFMFFEQRFSFSFGFNKDERLSELCKILNRWKKQGVIDFV